MSKLTRRDVLKLGGGVQSLLSDTVGFIRRLPHNLVASFHATLEEAREAGHEEGDQMRRANVIVVVDGSIEFALKQLKRAMLKTGTTYAIGRKECYVKPGDRRRRKSERARKRERKNALRRERRGMMPE